MAPDEAGLHLADDEDRDLLKVANLYSRAMGRPVTVRVSPRGGDCNDVRIKVARSPGDKMDVQDTAVVAVRPHPALLHGELAPEIARPLLAWASLNADALAACWTGELDTRELGARLRRSPN